MTLLLLLARIYCVCPAVACDGALLPNGICNPREWPPLWPGSGLPPREPSTPPYLVTPPPVINVSLGRQLFVDTFLIESMPGLQLLSHSAQWHGEVLRADRPWEAWVPSIPKQDYPQGPLASGLAYPFSGGLWWDERIGRFRLWYLCGSEVAIKRVGACYAESRDGLKWEKPLVGRGDVAGTNIVHEELFNGLVVWLDHEAHSASERFKMVTVPNSLKLQQFRLLSSTDGLSWSEHATSGPIGDRSTFFFDPFRQKYVWSIKEYYNGARSRSFVEGTDFFASASWSACTTGHLCRLAGATEAHCPCPWTSADNADPTWPYNDKQPAQLYNLDAAPYESLMVGLFSVFLGYANENATADPATRSSDEQNEIFLGFSRDGFHWWRQYDGTTQEGGERPRRPFMRNAWPVHQWNRADVQSVGGGFVVVNESIRFYSSGSKDLPFGEKTAHYHSRGNKSTGMAYLRRDGFTSVETLLAEPGILTTRQEQIAFAPYCTNFIIIVVQFEKRRNRKYHFWLDRPIVWSPRLKYLWVNVVIQPGGFLQASVLRNLTSADVVDAATSSRITSQGENDSFVPFERLRLNTSSVGGMTANTCVDPAAGVFDSTRAAVRWEGVSDLGSISGEVVKLRFRLSGASLYSFWLSDSTCGASEGYLGGGGPGSVDGRDMAGSCT